MSPDKRKSVLVRALRKFRSMKPEDPAHQHSSSLPSSNQTETISTQQRVPEVTPEIAPTDPPVAPELAEIETPDGELTLILNNQVQSVEQEPHLESTTSIAAAPISTVNSEPQAAVSPLPKIQGPGYTVTELYIPPASANAVVDIIFVHGLIGNAFNTWYHKQAEVYWPQELLKEDIRDARIMSFGYDADVVNWWSQASNNRIGNHAENMLGALVRLREETDTEERRIVFVTHSLGGLVTQKALALSRHSPFPHLRQLETCTRGIIFLGTPHIGADIAKWGGYAAKISSIARHTNVEIVKVLKPDSEMLGEIQRDFQGILRLRIEEHKAMEISCFFEELPVRLVGTIVPQHSARLQPYMAYGIHANHMDMTKFPGRADPGYIAVKGEILRPVRGIRREQTVLTTVQEECLRSLYYHDLNTREENVETAFGGTFDWIWLNEELSFTNWLQHGPGIFWVSGKPGSGKSTIMKYLAQHPRTYETLLVSNNNAMGQIPIITIHFFDYKGTAMNRSLEGLLRSLLWQIISQNPIVGNAVFLAFEDMKRKQGSINWSKAKLLTVFKRIIQEMWSFPLCIFVDALDEYVNPQSNTSQDSYTEVAEFFRNLTLTMPSTTRLCLASRFSAEFSYQFGGFPRFLLQHHTTDDIKAYACSKFADMISQEEPSYHILVNHVVQEAQGIFQWVRLVCEVILRCWRRKESLQRLQQRLHEMPKALGDLYQRILDELDDAERVEAGLILGIVACSARPLSPVELQYIVSNAGKDHILFTVDLRGRIEAICSGLVDVGPRQVRLSHETVLVFFQKYHSQVLRDGNLCVLRSCMAILSAAIKNKDVLVGREHSDFAKYAVLEWVKHAKQANSEGAGLQDKDWKPLTNSEFLIWYEIFLSVSWETPDFDRGRTYKVIDDSERTHKFSVRRVLEILVFRTLNIAISSKLFRSPSHWEKWSWRSPCLFLQDISSGIGLYTNTKIISDDGTHYLHCFLGGEKQPGEVFNGSELSQSTAFVEHLLKRNLDFIDTASLDDKFFTGNQSSDHELDPVLAADFALVLLDRRPFDSLVKLHVDDFFCRGEMTPMQLAAYRGIDQLLQILLENGANPNLAMRESAFGTPLLAAIYGLSHAKKSITVEPTYACFIMLLQRGADPNQNAFGYTLDESRSPLELAIIFLAVRIRDVERAGRRRVDGKELARQVKAGYSIHVNAEITNMAWVIKVLCSFGAFPNLATRQRIRAMPELCDYFAFGRFIERGFIERAQQRDTDTGCFDPAPSSSPASPFGMLYRATASAYTPREDIAGSSVYQLRATAPSTSRKVHKRH